MIKPLLMCGRKMKRKSRIICLRIERGSASFVHASRSSHVGECCVLFVVLDAIRRERKIFWLLIFELGGLSFELINGISKVFNIRFFTTSMTVQMSNFDYVKVNKLVRLLSCLCIHSPYSSPSSLPLSNPQYRTSPSKRAPKVDNSLLLSFRYSFNQYVISYSL